MAQFPADIATPAYVLDAAKLTRNMETARRIRTQTGARVLLATKAFAMPAAFPLMRDALDGTTASGLYEAKLGAATFGKEVHVYAPAFTEPEVRALTTVAGHIYFNSPEQARRFLPVVKAAGGMEVGLRVYPQFSHASLGGSLYDPGARYSRFGTPPDQLAAAPWEDIDILHVHALCEATHEGSIGLISYVARELAPWVARVKAVNFGGGHFINKPGYDVDALIAAIKAFRAQFGVEVILEPGAGLVVDAGWLVATVLALHRNEKDIAILDASASCHMPDVLEVPYTPPLEGAAAAGVHPHTYLLGGKTCMTGDIIGEYSFPAPLQVGQRLVFGDMMQYSFVKNTSFNGTPLPDLAILDANGTYRVVRRFGFEDFAGKLG